VKEIAIVYVLFGDRAAAEAAAGRMIEQRLAACANIQAGCQSVYRWQGAVERADETPVIFKTSLDRREALMAALAAIHAYELPAISSWTAMTSPAYASWVDEATQDDV
jgi:periplasmic divalent cation tolerance protein